MTLHDIQRAIVARIDERPVGSASRFRLMDAADALSRAIAAEEREGVDLEKAQVQPAAECVCTTRGGPEGCGICNETGVRRIAPITPEAEARYA